MEQPLRRIAGEDEIRIDEQLFRYTKESRLYRLREGRAGGHARSVSRYDSSERRWALK